MSADNGTGAAPLLVVHQVSVRYGNSLALSDVSFELAAGRTLAVVGPNGAGKSSLARSITGLVPVSGGNIWFDGKRISVLSPHKIRRLGLAYVPEGRGVFGTLTVQENLRMAVRWLPGRAERRDAVDRIIGLFPVLGQRLAQLASTLSGGEQQMLALGCELATNPSLVICDELSLGLAPKIVDEVYLYLDGIRRSGVTTLIIEQFVRRAIDVADQMIVLGRGTVLWNGDVSSVPEDVLLSQYLGGAQLDHDKRPG